MAGLLLLVMKDEEDREEKVFWLMDTLINTILPGNLPTTFCYCALHSCIIERTIIMLTEPDANQKCVLYQ